MIIAPCPQCPDGNEWNTNGLTGRACQACQGTARIAIFEVGDSVRFHPIIGGRHDGNLYAVRAIGEINNRPVVWLEGKSGCVDVRALSAPPPPVGPRRMESCQRSPL